MSSGLQRVTRFGLDVVLVREAKGAAKLVARPWGNSSGYLVLWRVQQGAGGASTEDNETPDWVLAARLARFRGAICHEQKRSVEDSGQRPLTPDLSNSPDHGRLFQCMSADSGLGGYSASL